MIVTLISNWVWELLAKQQIVMITHVNKSLVCLILSHWETWRSIQSGLTITVMDAQLDLEARVKVLLLNNNGMFCANNHYLVLLQNERPTIILILFCW